MSAQTPLLIIDDNAAFSASLARMLSRRGYEVETAASAQTGLARARHFKPARVILDMKLGDDSGIGLIRPLLQVRSDMRILLLTGYASIATTVSAIKLGAHDYLSKPASAGDIVHALEQSRENDTGAGSVEESPMPLRRLEWEHIQRVLERNQGNVSAAARELGMHRRSLQRKLQKRPAGR